MSDQDDQDGQDHQSARNDRSELSRSGERGGHGAGGGHAARDEYLGHPLARAARLVAAVLGPVVLTTAYFTVPFDPLSRGHGVLPWFILGGLLTLLAAGMVVTTARALTGAPRRSGRPSHPALGILLLSWASVLTFAASYWALATHDGQFLGLKTRLDALYFTGVTMATVGYGDIVPTGQTGRAIVLVQLVYTFAFLAGGLTALGTRLRTQLARRTQGQHGRHGRDRA